MKDWQEYENQIFDLLRKKFPKSNISFNQRLNGFFSKRKRQVDILVSEKILDKEVKIIIDCKKFNKKIDVKAVESFIGFCEDISAHIGIMITNYGYTESAIRRTENYHRDIQLEVVKFSELKLFIENFKFCSSCLEKGLKSIIDWNYSFSLIDEDIINLIDLGTCGICSQKTIRCQTCGTFLELGDTQVKCLCEETKYFILDKYKRIQVSLREFIIDDPDQLKLLMYFRVNY